MTTRELNRLLRQGAVRAERRHLSTLARVYKRTLEKAAVVASANFRALTADASFQPPAEGAILTLVATQTLVDTLNNGLAPIWRKILIDVALAPMERLRIAWDVSHPLNKALIDTASRRTGARLDEAVQGLIRKAVTDAYDLGLAVPEAADLIRSSVADAAPWQAEMLARTDLNSLANGASIAAARLAGGGFKTWLATLDDRTRETHVEAHGQTVPLHGLFIVGGEEAEYPGDPSLSDAEAANCRCTVVYADNLDEAAGLVASGSRHVKTSDEGGNMRSVSELATATRKLLGIGFEGIATIEGKISDDSALTPRVLLPDALVWPEMPVPFMAQTVTAEGHDGAGAAGRIDEFNRKRGSGRLRNIGFAGELTTPFGINEIAPMIADQTLRFVSVDLGATEWALVNRATLVEIPSEELSIDDLNAGAYALGLKAGKIKAVTLVPVQAIEGAIVTLTASADTREATLVFEAEFSMTDEALLAATAPARAPAAWFNVAEPPGKMPLTITEEGRVFGHLACWDQCHMAFLPACIPPPKSASNYAYFHAGELLTAEGDRIAVGKLMVGGRHDSNLRHSREEAMRHYDDTSRVGAFLRAVDGRHGIWVCGALNPKLSSDLVDELRVNPPSGDWRPVNGVHELICGLAVPVPGFATPRAEMVLVASGSDLTMGALVAALGPEEADPAALVSLVSDGVLSESEAEELDVKGAERRIRVLAARAEGIDALAALAEA